MSMAHLVIRIATGTLITIGTPFAVRGIAIFNLEMVIRRLRRRGEPQQVIDALRRMQDRLRWGRRRQSTNGRPAATERPGPC